MWTKPGRAEGGRFTTTNSDGALVAADATPTGVVFFDGVSDTSTVTITSDAVGKYAWAVTVSDVAIPGTRAEIELRATIVSISTADVIEIGRVVPADRWNSSMSDTDAWDVNVTHISDFLQSAGDVVSDALGAWAAASAGAAPTSDANAVAVWASASRTITTPASDFMATGFSVHSAADVWTAGSRELSTPANYKATGFSTHAAADVWTSGTRTLTTPASDFMATGFVLASKMPPAWSDLNIVDGVIDANTVQISSDAGAADALESQYDTTGLNGPTYPAPQSQITGIANVGAASNVPVIAAPNGFVITTGTGEVNDEDATKSPDGTLHQISDDGGTLDVYYLIDIEGDGVPVSVTFLGRANGLNDDLTIWVNTGTIASPTWEQRDTLTGIPQSVNTPKTVTVYTTDGMTGADAGKVALRFYGTGLNSATLSIDHMFGSKTSKADNTGYQLGAIWIDEDSGNTNTVADVDGTARNPCTWVAGQTLNGSLGFNKFRIANGNTIVPSDSLTNFTLEGQNWTLQLNGQVITGLHTQGANVFGTATATDEPGWHDCSFGVGTYPPGEWRDCGFGVSDGLFTGGQDGNYTFINPVSLVPDPGTPDFTWAGRGTTGINYRGGHGGFAGTLSSDCTVTVETDGGGGQTFNTNGASVELRGIFREATFNCSGAGTIQQVGVCGPITITGTATTAVKLYGVSSEVTDTSTGTAVSDYTVSRSNVQSDVWTNTDRTLTTPLSDFHAVPSDTWAASSRTLTTEASDYWVPPSDVWAASGRALSTPSDYYGIQGSDATIAGVWAYVSRTLTTPASDFKATGFSVHSAADVWSSGTRTLTTPASDFKATVPTSDANAVAVWASASRTLTTPVSDFHAPASDVWAASGRLIENPSSDYMATGFSVHSAADVWTAGSRALSVPSDYYGASSDANATAVWVSGTRTLTTPASDFMSTGFSTHAASDVWASTTRSLTTPASDFQATVPTSDAIAQAVLITSVSDVVGSLTPHSLGVLVLGGLESSRSGLTWTIYQTDGVTPLFTKTLTSDSTAVPVTGVT